MSDPVAVPAPATSAASAVATASAVAVADAPVPAAAVASKPPLVEIVGLSRRFGQKQAVQDLSFAFGAGVICGFIGPNGAGKSTTMRILATLDLPSAGTCRIAGLDVVDHADRVRRLLGYMPDSYGTYPNLMVEEYLDFFARAYGLAGAARRARVDEIVAFCQLGELRDKAVTTLSKGMKQRLCLGRCLINDPQVLVLDEPTAGLDPRARIEFRELLRILVGQGRAVLISSHILSELEEVCDQVAIIELGRLVAFGTVAAVKARARHATEQAEPARLRRLEWRVAGDAGRARLLLAEDPQVTEVVDEGHGALTCTFSGSTEDQARLLARLVAAGLGVYHLAARSENLEDAFMRLTEGAVQ